MTATLLPAPAVISPDWPAPDNVVAMTTCRMGGVSAKPYNKFNLAEHVGDSVDAVNHNRQRLLKQCDGLDRIQWLNQIHGVEVVEAGIAGSVDADASFTSKTGLACAVLTADCLPIIICDSFGLQVAAVHAGWRGLVAGIIERTRVCFNAHSKDLMVWLGPAISQTHFEVGSEVRQAFINAAEAAQLKKTNAAFVPNVQHSDHYFADLFQLARIRLQSMGISKVYGGELCSYSDQARFYSYRRDGVTGRMVTMIYKPY